MKGAVHLIPLLIIALLLSALVVFNRPFVVKKESTPSPEATLSPSTVSSPTPSHYCSPKKPFANAKAFAGGCFFGSDRNRLLPFHNCHRKRQFHNLFSLDRYGRGKDDNGYRQ